MIWVGYSAMWISVATAASYGVYRTGSSGCLWALVIPLFVSLTEGRKKGKVE